MLLNSDRRDVKESVATLGSFHLLHILDRDPRVNYLCSKFFSPRVRLLNFRGSLVLERGVGAMLHYL